MGRTDNINGMITYVKQVRYNLKFRLRTGNKQKSKKENSV